MPDHLLAALLLAGLPGRSLWYHFFPRPVPPTKAGRYRAVIGIIDGLLILLTLDWASRGRSPAALGLGAPITTAALAGLGIAVALLCLMAAMAGRTRHRAPDTKPDSLALLPETVQERRLFMALAVTAGFGWEVLYRGFLYFYLEPRIGAIATVAASAIAYGVGHEWRGRRQFARALLSAVAFTTGYAATLNLWWLILLHAGLPLLILCGRSAAASSEPADTPTGTQRPSGPPLPPLQPTA